MKKSTLNNLIIFAFLLAICVLFSSCMSNGGGGYNSGARDSMAMNAISSTFKAAEDITPEQEYYIGRSVAANIVQRYSVYSDKTVEKYLNNICGALILNSPKPVLFKNYYVAILDSDEINAFATSGGHIFVTKGLLRCTNSEDELAAVLAHEIAHIQLGHGISAIKTNRITNAVKNIGKVFAVSALNENLEGLPVDVAELVESFDGAVGDVVNKMVDSGYSKANEFEADKTALSLMTTAGYYPYAMESMLKMIDANTPKNSGGFGKTHPKPKDRIKRVQEELEEYYIKDTSKYRTERFETSMRSFLER